MGKSDPEAKKVLDAVSAKFKTFKAIKASFALKIENAAGKVQGVKTKLGTAFDNLLDTGDSSEVSSSFTVPDEKPEELSQEEKLELFSKVKNDDDFYKAILFGIGAPTSKHNIDFLI